MRLLPENPPNITERAVRRAWTVVGVLAVLVLVVTVIGLVRLSDSNETLTDKVERYDADRADLSKRLDIAEADSAKQKKASVALAEQVERYGGKPVVDPANPSAPPVALGPTNAQVQAAIKVICAGEQSLCIPTQAQVKAALTAICANGACRGEDAETPEDGRNGTNGQDATDAQTDAAVARQIDAAVARHCAEDGCRGPGPTDQQVDDRLAVFCADGACKGDSVKGEPGSVTPGDYACPDGEWITAIHVVEGGAMTVDCAPLLGRGD